MRVEYSEEVTSIPRIFSKGVLSVFVSTSVLFGGAGHSLAQIATPTASPQSTVVLATVNIRDAKIVSQEGNTFHISFSLSNREGVQMGVKYGVQLVSENGNSSFIMDEKIYPEVLTLGENSNVSKEITYTAPQNLSGTYALLLSSKNESGFPFALAFVGNVTLTASVKGITVDPTSCFLQVSGEKGSPHYDLTQGVDIAQTENLILTCSATNTASTALSATPLFETHYRSAYGNVVSQTGGDTSAISFAALQKKTFSIMLPKAGEPQAYDVSMTLKSGNMFSNTVVAHYVISGSSATVQTISIDKNFYKKGDTATLPFIWSPSADAFPNARIGTGTPSAVSANITMTDGSGNTCIAPVKESLSAGKLNVPLLLTADCTDPHVSLSLVDAKGSVLAKKELMIASPIVAKSELPAPASMPFIPVAITLGILAVLGGGIYMLKRKNDVPPQMPLP